MKLLLSDSKIAATALDDYQGPMEFIQAPEDFDISKLHLYRYENNQLILLKELLTPLQFLRRFTQEERINIRNTQNPIITDFMYLLERANDIDLTDTDIVNGINYLVENNLLTQERATEILS